MKGYHMAENTSSSGGMGLIGVIIGALLVAAVGFFVLQNTGVLGGKTDTVNVKIDAPSIKP
jgi:hypothetical protein